MNGGSTGNQPEKKFSTGAISATIWRNNATRKKTGEQIDYRTITLQRRYADKDGKWQTSNSLRLNDLPKASLVLQKAYEYLVLKGQDSSSKGQDYHPSGQEQYSERHDSYSAGSDDSIGDGIDGDAVM